MNLQAKSLVEESPEHRSLHLRAGCFALGLRQEIVLVAVKPGWTANDIQQAGTPVSPTNLLYAVSIRARSGTHEKVTLPDEIL
jgi:hypothetical protein